MEIIRRNLLLSRVFGAILVIVQSVTVTAGFIDMDTPLDKRTTTSIIDGTTYNLVMSDEFNVPNRSFKDGHDAMWTALDKSDDDSSQSGGGALQFYNSSWVSTTEDGMLKILATIDKTKWTRYDHVNKKWKNEETFFTSGMVQSWEKFCFTGGIVEVDLILPGNPHVGGLWPAVWMLGNLGRATYEASTNNIWPWSYNKCDRKAQSAQAISACDKQNHFGMHPYQGRGATEIDIIEVMTGDSYGPLPSTDPPISLPYADFTLQIAPGITENRPQSGNLPLRENVVYGHTEYFAQTWYDDLIMNGNTSINPFFYGTYLAETKPYEPVLRSKNEAFQADAVGVAHQLNMDHFTRPYTYRVEWQPGKGGRLDWFVRRQQNSTEDGDADEEEWTHAFGVKDKSLSDVMGSQIPNEPSSLIMNLAISSTWGFPYDAPGWCQKCYDCTDPKCSCAFNAGFCEMLKTGDVAMYIDSIRVYQSNDTEAHVGGNHTLGCDPPDYPTREWIIGHGYRYMRNKPFSYEDYLPLRKVQKGGGECFNDTDCGGDIIKENYTAIYLGLDTESRQDNKTGEALGRGKCVDKADFDGLFSILDDIAMVCKCNEGYTGPRCMSLAHFEDAPSAYKMKMEQAKVTRVDLLKMTPFMIGALVVLVPFIVGALMAQINYKRQKPISADLRQPFVGGNANLIITGRSV